MAGQIGPQVPAGDLELPLSTTHQPTVSGPGARKLCWGGRADEDESLSASHPSLGSSL